MWWLKIMGKPVSEEKNPPIKMIENAWSLIIADTPYNHLI
jgi:hypothetical protein